jgi:hypothetical protein
MSLNPHNVKTISADLEGALIIGYMCLIVVVHWCCCCCWCCPWCLPMIPRVQYNVFLHVTALLGGTYNSSVQLSHTSYAYIYIYIYTYISFVHSMHARVCTLCNISTIPLSPPQLLLYSVLCISTILYSSISVHLLMTIAITIITVSIIV